LTAYRGEPLTSPVDAAVLVLAARARGGRLVVCAGAGLSIADDAGLPSGRRLGELLDERLVARLAGYTSPADTNNLLDVADAAFDAAGGLLPLQYEVLEIADFERATPNFGHRTLALLLSEGAVANLLLWNWDDCVERSALEGEPLQVARTLEDVEQLRVPGVAKIHGCATRVPTLLITTEQLQNPPLWADAAFATQLRSSTGVFIGIGDIADYARRRLEQLNAEIPELDVYVVSPSIQSNWAASVWAQIMPGLSANRRVEKTADEFLDQLARVWALELVEGVEGVTNAFTGANRGGVASMLTALRQLCGSEVIAWSRTGAFRRRAGRSVVRSTEAQEAVIALGVLAGERAADVSLQPDARCGLGPEIVEVLITCEAATASQLRAEAQRRAERLSGRGMISEVATFLVSGAVVGPLNQPESVDLAEGRVEPTDVLRGPSAISVRYIAASEVLGRAA
jgi:hypothetical protein